jgi:uncharacterized protein YutE (UPF0331/DUF86 family)
MALILDDLRAATPIAAKAFASRIAACAGLRNRLVHEYDEIDPRRVHEGLVATVRDVPEYLRRVHDYLEGLTPPPDD